MKKYLTLIICFAMVLCIGVGRIEAAGTKTSKITAKYIVGSYTIELPSTYKMQILEEVKAEANAIAMLIDKGGNYPDLWIYEDKLDGADLSKHIAKQNAIWKYNKIEIKEGYAITMYDENWYGKDLKNEHYYKITKSGTVLGFDFAYDASVDAKANHAKIVEVASMLGFK